MSGFFSEQDSRDRSAKSEAKSFNTNDLLDELNQMRIELQHHVDFSQKSSNLFESPLIEPSVFVHDDKKPMTETMQTAAPSPVKPHPNGYTQSHQFRIDPAHPEIGEKRDEVKSKRDSIAPIFPKDVVTFPEKMMELPKNEGSNPSASKQEEIRLRHPDPLAFLASQEPAPSQQPNLPPIREIMDSKSQEMTMEYSDVIPMSSKQESVSFNQEHSLRIDSRHYADGSRVFESPKHSPASTYHKKNDSASSQMSFNEMLTTVFMTLGCGAFACFALLHLRVLVFKLESWPPYGIHLIVVGVVFCCLGVIFRSHTNQKSFQSKLYPHNPRPNRDVITRFDQGDPHQLKKTYQRLLELRNQVDEMISHVENRVSATRDETPYP